MRAQRSEGWHGGRAHDRKAGRPGGRIADPHDVADAFVQLGRRYRTKHHLVRSVEPVPGQDRGLHGRARALTQDRYDLAVDGQVAGVVSRPCPDIAIAGKEQGGLALRDVAGATART